MCVCHLQHLELTSHLTNGSDGKGKSTFGLSVLSFAREAGQGDIRRHTRCFLAQSPGALYRYYCRIEAIAKKTALERISHSHYIGFVAGCGTFMRLLSCLKTNMPNNDNAINNRPLSLFPPLHKFCAKLMKSVDATKNGKSIHLPQISIDPIYGIRRIRKEGL